MGKKVKKIVLLFLAMLLIGIPRQICAAEKTPIEDARKGIVEIRSGFLDEEGVFRQMKCGSGFLISNDEQGIYIATALAIAENSTEERKAYCEAHGISAEYVVPSNMVEVIVTGDVTVEASVLTKSTEQGFCILSIDNVVNEKTALRLGDSAALKKDTNVYALGFPENTNGVAFVPTDVEIQQGQIQNDVGEAVYMQHTGLVNAGNFGGPLIDEHGYVVGINCRPLQTGKAQSLAINEIKEVLDNFSIYYECSQKDALIEKINKLYDECTVLNENGSYKKDSLKKMQETMVVVDGARKQEYPTVESLDEAYTALATAKVSLVPKMEVSLVIIYILMVVILVLTVRLVQLMVLESSDKKRAKQEQALKQNSALAKPPKNAGNDSQRLVQNIYVGQPDGNDQAIQQQIVIKQTVGEKPAWQQQITVNGQSAEMQEYAAKKENRPPVIGAVQGKAIPEIPMEIQKQPEQSMQLMQSGQTKQPEPPEQPEQIKQPVSFGETRQPMVPEGIRRPVSFDETRQPIEPEGIRRPVSFGGARQPIVPEGTRRPVSFGETRQPTASGRSEQFLMESQSILHLIRQGNGERVPITKPNFVIGKRQGVSDYCVTGNPAVSREHAQIIYEEGVYYIKDLGSANGTFLNGQRVFKGKLAEIKAGDTLVLANEKFMVQ